MQNNLNLSAEAISTIAALQHKNGTYGYYRETLDSLHAYILHQGDEMGMSDTESLHILRVLDAISSDLAALAGPAATCAAVQATREEVAGRVNEMFNVDPADTFGKDTSAEAPVKE